MIPKLVAHRGYMERYPENTLTGLNAALNAGACFIEFDVQMTADKKFIVMHDDDFKRTAGVKQNIFDATLSDVSKISVHEQDRLGNEFSGTYAPTLERVLHLVEKHPDARAFVEIKDESIDQWGLEYVMDQLIDALVPFSSQCVIISFNREAIEYAKTKTACLTGWVIELFDDKYRELANKLKPDYLLCNYKKISDTQELWSGNWQWLLYDITDPELAIRWCERGAELIETRDIGAMLEHESLRESACKHD